VGEIFERTMPAESLAWTGERLTTGAGVGPQVETEHLHRYFLARALCHGLDVLDVASGEGYQRVDKVHRRTRRVTMLCPRVTFLRNMLCLPQGSGILSTRC